MKKKILKNFTGKYERVDRFPNHLETMVVSYTSQQKYNQQTKHRLIKKKEDFIMNRKTISFVVPGHE